MLFNAGDRVRLKGASRGYVVDGVDPTAVGEVLGVCTFSQLYNAEYLFVFEVDLFGIKHPRLPGLYGWYGVYIDASCLELADAEIATFSVGERVAEISHFWGDIGPWSYAYCGYAKLEEP